MSTAGFAPQPGAAPLGRQVLAQARMETRLLLRNGEQLLLALVIPVLVLAGGVAGTDRLGLSLSHTAVDELTPGVLALALMSTSFTSLAIATGFERRYGVLRRLGTTPLPRGGLLLAKTCAVVAVEVLQVALLAAVGIALGWSPHGSALRTVGLLLLGTAAFSALGLLMAGTLRAEATLAGANLVYLTLLVLGGVAFPLSDFSPGLRHVLELLPIAALTEGLRGALAATPHVTLTDSLTLAAWALVPGVLASRLFRWE